jgi:hypothetical protein
MKSRLLNWLQRRLFKRLALSDIEQARMLIQAVDRGGIPLNPARVNHIARNLGLDVSTRAPVDQTIARIRACVQRAASS